MKRFGLTYMQEAMLFEVLSSSPSRYVSVLRYELSEPIDAQTLEKRAKLLAERHEALRASFSRGGDGIIWQEVADHVDADFSVVDAYTDEKAEISPFGGNLFRLILCRGELIVIFHHALLDGWSVGILMRELLAGEEPVSKTCPFRYYVKYINQRNYADDLKWWKNYLDGKDTCSDLPNALNACGYERRELHFKLTKSELLRQRASDLRVTAGRLIQAVWCMLIARYNGGDSVVLNVISGRSAPVPGIVEMVGMCVNTLPVVTKLPKPPESITFAGWVSQWNRQTAEAEKHGFCRLGDLIKGPIPHILAIEPPFDGRGYKLKSTNAELVTDFDAVFTLGSEIEAKFAYNSFAYPAEAVEAIKGHFLTALDAVLENPGMALEQIPILTGAEISELTALNENQEILDIIERQTIVDFWHESAMAYQDHTALVCGNARLTYAELAKTADKLSAALKAHGFGAEKSAALKLNRSEKYVIAELAVLKAGGLFIPLDPEWPDERIQAILAETKPFLVIDEDFYAQLLTGRQYPCPTIMPSPAPRDAAYMIMTSGTTGIPKGVVVTHRNIANFCLWAREHYNWRVGDSCAMALGFGFDGSMWDIWLPLISGGTLHILQDDVRLSINGLGEYCKKERITHLDLPVTLADSFREVYRDGKALPGLRVMVTGGEEVRRVTPAPYPLSNEYGPTECTVCCSAGWVNADNSPVPVGSPPPNMHAYILDGWGRLCPDGVEGEACFSGVQVARGYYNSPELTAARFISNPFANGNTNHQILYRSGDLMKWRRHNGSRELIFRGRADSQVKINGYRIELGEIESVLRPHPSVNAVAAAVKETPSGEKKICAYLVPKGEIDLAELNSALAVKLPAFMRPVISIVEEIPLNASGKVDYGLLPFPGSTSVTERAEPVTEHEKILVAVIAELLNAPDIGTAHNYLELGGNSINAMRIAHRLELEGYELTAIEIIKSGNLSELAARMRPVAPVQTDGRQEKTFIPLSAQQAMVFLAETESSASYTVTLRLNAKGLDQGELRRRLDRAAKLHDILRTVFEYGKDGRILGRVRDECEIPLRIGGFEPMGGINPLRGPLLDLTLSGEELIIRYHHIALDGFSVNLLKNEILSADFPESAPSFAKFANRLATQTTRRVDDEKWWRKTCRQAKIVPLLPPKTKEKPEYKRITACQGELFAKCALAAKKERVTPAAFALTAWGVALCALGAENDDILIPFVASSRGDDRLMGMCAAVYPLKFGCTGETFGGLARSVQETVLESVRRLFVPQDIIGRLPQYLFVFEDSADSLPASGEQNYDLVIKFAEQGELIYNTKRIPEERARVIAARLEAALTAAIENRVSVFYEGEHELVTKTFAHGCKLAVRHQTAAAAFSAAADTFAGHIALETEHQAFTYAELHQQAGKLAGELNAQGIGPGDIVAFSLPRDAEGIIAQIGIALSGAALLPLDPAWPRGRIDDILNDSGAAAVIRSGMKIEFTGTRGKVPPDSAYLIYTSGTTGKPKGVILPQAALANQIAWTLDEFGFGTADKMLHYVAFTFDPSVWTIFTTIAAGATLSLLSDNLRLDPEAVASYIRERNITLCTLPAAVGPDVLRRVKTSGLRLAFLGGEALKNLPPRSGGLETVNLYGPTETCINATFRRMPPNEAATSNIGRPVANMSCYVLDAHGKPCPAGIQGELCLGGVQLAHGYLNRREENAAAFVENPLFGKLYRTGDCAVWNEDGTLEFLGRKDRQVKIRGNRVEIGEIEHALCKIPEILDARIKLAGNELDAYIIWQKNTPPLDAARLRQKLSEHLPPYMLPRTVTTLAAFPLTENGKVDFSALPIPSIETAIEDGEYLSKTEKTVAAAWKTALALDANFTIGRRANFFDLGGHSLLLFQVVGLLAASGVVIDIKTLMQHPVLADLANTIDRLENFLTDEVAASFEENTDKYRLYVQEMGKIDISAKRSFGNILITGGTGFLGNYLIYEFFKNTGAVIHLPVRGSVERIKDALAYYFGAQGEEIAVSERLRVYSADISEKTPPIDIPLDAIFHAAADIRHYAPAIEMYKANVTATENMLELAMRQPNALFAHISTTGTVNAPFISETDADLGPPFDNIYQRTKQLAEQSVLDAGKRGLKFAVFRAGNIAPCFETGTPARNSESNALFRLTKAMFLTGLLPDTDIAVGYAFVNETSRAIRLLSQPQNLAGKIFHLDNPYKVKFSKLFELAGVAVEILPPDELTAKLRLLITSNDAAIRQAASEYLGRISQSNLEKESGARAGRLRMDATLLLLKRQGFAWPQMTEKYLKILKWEV